MWGFLEIGGGPGLGSYLRDPIVLGPHLLSLIS